MQPDSLLTQATEWLDRSGAELVEWRRALHRHPEVAFGEHVTTERLMGWLTDMGLDPQRLAVGTGVVCDIGPGPDYLALRADIDALPISDTKLVPYASEVAGVCHACGHDAHTAVLLGVAACIAAGAPAGGAMSQAAGAPAGGGQRSIRLIFQPAEERMPGGAEAAMKAGVLNGVSAIFALHCDPKLDTGRVGLRSGPITAAFNQLEIALSGPGGHTARPHLTVDLVYALGKLVIELPGLLSRRVDPRSALSLVWGSVSAGVAPNAIPQAGMLRGTLRMLDGGPWGEVQLLVRELVNQIVAPTGAKVEIAYDHGVPAVVNDIALVGLQTRAAVRALGEHATSDTRQSMGGEDFAWYLQEVPGAMARLGVRRPGQAFGDLHQSSFDIDEDALAVGVRFTAAIVDEFWSVSVPDVS